MMQVSTPCRPAYRGARCLTLRRRLLLLFPRRLCGPWSRVSRSPMPPSTARPRPRWCFAICSMMAGTYRLVVDTPVRTPVVNRQYGRCDSVTFTEIVDGLRASRQEIIVHYQEAAKRHLVIERVQCFNR